jgi:DNA-binding transcriptional LysR family regulator
MFDNIDEELSALSEMAGRPAGNIRITAADCSANAILIPAAQQFLLDHPDVNLEVVIDYALTIVAERYCAGIRLGGIVAKDMVAVAIGPDERSIVVAAPGYFQRHDLPLRPEDLTAHRCINLRLPTFGGLYSWEFEKDGRPLRIRVDGQLTFSSVFPIFQAALCGLGVAYLPIELIRPHLVAGALLQVLSDYTPPYFGFHLYYPSGLQTTMAFKAFVDSIRYRQV